MSKLDFMKGETTSKFEKQVASKKTTDEKFGKKDIFQVARLMDAKSILKKHGGLVLFIVTTVSLGLYSEVKIIIGVVKFLISFI